MWAGILQRITMTTYMSQDIYENYTAFGSVERLTDPSQSGERRFFVSYYNVTADEWEWAKTTNGNGLIEPFQLVQEPSTNSVYIAGYNTGSEIWDGGILISNPQSTWAGWL